MATKELRKVAGTSLNPQAEVLKQLKRLCPEVFADGKVDPDKLRRTLGEELIAGEEAYGLSWAGKSECFRHLQEPTSATLKPCPKESADFDKTENLFLEGDNLEVLKVLQRSYYGAVRMIYIDPPYNTGSDSFIYPDRFTEEREGYEQRAGIKDAEGFLIKDGFWRKNSRDAGHFHSNWLSMMYPRLFLARNLLRADGVIFVSIDDNEIHNLRMIMNEIFGEENFVANIVWQKTYSPANDKHGIDTMHDSILCYQRSELGTINFLPRTEKQDAAYKNPDNDPRGPWKSVDATRAEHRDYAFYPIETPSGKTVYPSKGRSWVFKKEEVPDLLKDNRLWFGPNGDSKPSIKRFLTEVKQGIVPTTWWSYTDAGHNDTAKKELKALFPDNMPFETPKPTQLIQRMLQLATGSSEGDIVLDFFAGSCTTGQSVMAMNAEDGGKRQFICVQMAEPCAEDSEAYKAGFKSIAEIGKERIRRAAKKIKSEVDGFIKDQKNNPKLFEDENLKSKIENLKSIDLGFKVFKLAESNFKQWRQNVATTEKLKDQLFEFVDNKKKAAQANDMLYEIILKHSRFDLNVPAEELSFDGVSYCRLADGSEIICLAERITRKFVDKILKDHPQKFTCLDSAFANNDQLKTNTALQLEAGKIEFKVI